MGEKITVVLAEDYEVVRKGLRASLEAISDIEVVGEAADGIQLSDIVQSEHPKIVVLDFVMNEGGVPLIKKLTSEFPEIGIVVFSLYDNKAYITGSLEGGAKAYVLKESSMDELVYAIREVSKGKRYLSTKLSQMAIDALLRNKHQETDLYSTLTPREKEVLQLVVDGFSSTEIARKLSISKRTVDIHRANLVRKLNLRPQSLQLADYARKLGILHDDVDMISPDVNKTPNN